MKKALVLLLGLCLSLALTACSKSNKPALDQLPDDYSYEDAVADGCVVFENSDVASGQSIWDAFLEKADAGNKASVRLAYYYTLDDPSRYAPEYYEEIKDDYPLLFVTDLTFDGSEYMIEEYEDGAPISRTFKYLMKYEGAPSSKDALYYSYLYYVLVNDDTVTWEDIERGMLSSVFGAAIDHYRVYFDLDFK